MEHLNLLIGESLLLLLLVCCSAFFSGSEVSLFSLSRARLLAFRDSARAGERTVFLLMNNYHRTLITLILGNMFINTALSMVNDSVIQMLTTNKLLAEILSVVIGVVLLLALGEVTPITIALNHAERIAPVISRPVLILRKILRPVILLVDYICARVLDLLGRRKSEPLTAEEYSTYLEMASVGGAFTDSEKKLLFSALMLGEKRAGEVMTARPDVTTVSRHADAREVAELIRHERHQFYPVVERDIDDAELLLSAKAFFLLKPEERNHWQQSGAVIASRFIPEQVTLPQALENFEHTGVSAALITDEYGRVTGLLTAEDIFSEMLGSIEDEHNSPDYSFRQTIDGGWEFDGMIPVYFFEEVTGWQLGDDLEANTVNGVFSEKLGRLPVKDDQVKINGVRLRVQAVSRRRVAAFLAEKCPAGAKTGETAS